MRERPPAAGRPALLICCAHLRSCSRASRQSTTSSRVAPGRTGWRALAQFDPEAAERERSMSESQLWKPERQEPYT